MAVCAAGLVLDRSLLIGSDILVEVQALHEQVTTRAIRTMQTHLKLTGARIGIVVPAPNGIELDSVCSVEQTLLGSARKSCRVFR
jgi:hypothetical protein